MVHCLRPTLEVVRFSSVTSVKLLFFHFQGVLTSSDTVVTDSFYF